MTKKRKKTIYIIGPTASGKSDLAIEIAHCCGGEIISCDSRQIYRHMNIGTGKEPGTLRTRKSYPSSTKKAYFSGGIPHYLIDSHHPNTPFSAGKFVTQAARIREDIWARGKTPIICGGTMFWAQSLLEGMNDLPGENPALRKKLQSYRTQELLEKLRKTDKKRYTQICEKKEEKNRVRIIRALEILEECAEVPPLQKTDYKKLNKDNLIISLDWPREKLKERIAHRLEKRLKQGMVQEVRHLHEKHGVSWKRIESFGLEYTWSKRFLKNEVDKTEFTHRLQASIWQYAKRQYTWITRWEKSGARIHKIQSHKKAKTIVEDFMQKAETK